MLQPATSNSFEIRRHLYAALVACVLAMLVWPATANAASGAAPTSQQRRVLSKTHTDAIAVFAENGGLTLATKADVDGNLGVRLDPNLTTFNVEESTRTTVPASASYAFLGAAGSDVWLAPESNPGGTRLWPGFSTDDVPTGWVDGNQLTLRLESVTGPGTLHVFQSTAFGEPSRLFGSTDSAYRAWTLPRGTHAHANWAFSSPGNYTLTFSASALTNGVSISTTQRYAFVVGHVPAAVVTTTTLTASTNGSVRGNSVILNATVVPANAVGWVEFLDGAAILGHDPVASGSAALATTNLALGARSVTARFVPQWLNDFSASTSLPEDIIVTERGGVPFSTIGIAASYQPGDIMQARIAGVTLAEGQEIQWRMRPVGTDHTGTVLGRFVLPELNNPDSRAGRLDMRLDASYDGYELQAALMQGEQTLGMTAWVPVRVLDAVEPLSLGYVGPVPFRIGDTASLAANGRALAPGETIRIALYPGLPHYSLWFVPPGGFNAIAPRAFQFEPSGQALAPLALQVVRDGLVVAQSEPLTVDAARAEFFFEGMQPVYRVGQTFSGSIRVVPDLGDKVTYSWAMYDNYQNPMKVAMGESGRTFEMPITADMDGKRMFIQANVIYPSGNVGLVGGAYPYLTVTTHTTQLFLFSSLPTHYHQGDTVSLTLTADPGLAAGDSVAWEWRWPGTDWATLPGANGLGHQITAEQAMEGLEVRATLRFGHTNLTLVAGPVAVHVDDHGILANQQPTVAGDLWVSAGDTVTLTRHLPANGPTILTTHRWERKAAGASEFAVIANATAAQLTFTATLADDGAQYRVSMLKPDGTLAYGPSPAVTLDVAPSTPVEFAIAGIAPSYLPGQTMNATVVGTNLQSGQNFRWQMRPVGSSGTGANVVSSGTSNTYTRVISAADDGYEIRVLLRSGSTMLAQTAWVPITVGNLVEPLSLTWTAGSPAYMGDPLTASISGRALVEGEGLRVVRRTTGTWSVPDRTTISNNIVTTEPLSGPFTGEWALQVVSNSVAVAQSAPIPVQWLQREITIAGVQGVYRVGQSIQATATIYPPRDGIDFHWSLIDLTTLLSEDFPGGTDPLALTFERVVGLTNHNNQFSLVAFWTYPDGAGANIGQGNATINVSTADPSAQLFFLNSLGAHYHQGDLIGLELIADPGLAQGDTIAWEWKWPGADWTAFPGASGLSNDIVAEQVLEGVQVRATLGFGHTNTTMVADPVTIHVDDHGAAPRQQLTIAGGTSHTAGDTVTLARQLPANGPTILTTHRWERKGAGASEFTVIANATAAQLTFTATMLDDGAEYRVAILKPDGTLAYGPSPAVAVEVAPPVLMAISLANGSATLSITTRNGLTYQLQSAPAVTGPWTDVGDPISGTGQVVPVVVPVSGPAGFFQWRVVGNP